MILNANEGFLITYTTRFSIHFLSQRVFVSPWDVSDYLARHLGEIEQDLDIFVDETRPSPLYYGLVFCDDIARLQAIFKLVKVSQMPYYLGFYYDDVNMMLGNTLHLPSLHTLPELALLEARRFNQNHSLASTFFADPVDRNVTLPQHFGVTQYLTDVVTII